MINIFPPAPRYPLGYDDDKTLLKVYNTSEAELTQDCPAWSEEVHITPVAADKNEQWGDNGYANIEGELFYYDGVERDENGKIKTLKRCLRNLGGTKTKHVSKGKMVRGFVVAEHHNQLVDAVLKLEEFILSNDDFINEIDSESPCVDDNECPDVIFNFNVLNESNCEGTEIEYNLIINGPFTSFRIDFGDGNFTTSDQSGTHNFAPSAIIDPVVVVTNNTCQVVQTPPDRENPEEPPIAEETPDLVLPIPEIPEFPIIQIPNIEQPPTTLTLPPIQRACLTAPGGTYNIPSVIVVEPPIQIPSVVTFEPPINLPSLIGFEPIDIPSLITIEPSIISFDDPGLPSVITFGDINIPSFIEIGDINIPSEITIAVPNIPAIEINVPEIPAISFAEIELPSAIFVLDDIPTTISVSFDVPDISVDIPPISIEVPEFPTISIDSPEINVNIPSEIVIVGSIPSEITITGDIPTTINVDFGSPPTIPVDWGSPPTITVSVQCGDSQSSQSLRALSNDRDYDDSDEFLAELESPTIEVDYDDSMFPSEIIIRSPKFDPIKIEHDLPDTISVDGSSLRDIYLVPGEGIPKSIELVGSLPETIEVRSTIPSIIELTGAENIPGNIQLVWPENAPDKIVLEAIGIPSEIQVVGLPKTIELKHDIPSQIEVKFPEKYEIDMVYRGGPLPLKFDTSAIFGDDGDGDMPCFMLAPCPKP